MCMIIILLCYFFFSKKINILKEINFKLVYFTKKSVLYKWNHAIPTTVQMCKYW